MPRAIAERRPLSSYFKEPLVADAFRRAKRNTPPEYLAVEADHAPVLTPGAAVLPAIEA